MGIVPVFILFNEASINAFLHLTLDFFNLFLWQRDRDDASLASFQILVSISGPSGPVFLQERGGGKAPNTSS